MLATASGSCIIEPLPVPILCMYRWFLMIFAAAWLTGFWAAASFAMPIHEQDFARDVKADHGDGNAGVKDGGAASGST